MTHFPEDPRVAEARAQPIEDVAERLGILETLTRVHPEWMGPCPICGGRDRFAINTRKGVFQCRKCATGGDAIRLVEFVRGCDFPAALEWLCGPREAVPEAERLARERAAAERRKAAAERSARERARARAVAWELWSAGKPAEGTPVRDYLTRRAILPSLMRVMPACLRFHPDLAYTVDRGPDRPRLERWQVIHRGPAMLAAVQGPDGHFIGVHRTWLDLGQPKGKAVITDPATGEAMAAKKSLGSVMGGAIRLRTPKGATTMVMGEGIETTLSAMVSGAHAGAAFWAGVSLGNISGRMKRGLGLKFAGIPEPNEDDKPSFIPPPWVARFILVQDGDSEPRDTRAKCLSGARRAMLARPGLSAAIAHPGEGRDLNDVLMEGDDAPEV